MNNFLFYSKVLSAFFTQGCNRVEKWLIYALNDLFNPILRLHDENLQGCNLSLGFDFTINFEF